MKSCPRCSFLMDDDQTCCAQCAEDSRREPRMGGYAAEDAGIHLPAAAAGPTSSGGTALLAPPAPPPLPETVTFRSSGPAIRPAVLLLLVPLAAIVVAAAGYLGHGPLADQFVRWGLTSERAELLPATWAPVIDPSGSFRADLPAGSTDVFTEFDPADLAAGWVVGEHVEGVSGASMEAAWTTFGYDPEAISAFEDPGGLRALAQRYVDTRFDGAPMTVARDAQVPEGHAVDVVLADSSDVTTRVRFVLADGRFYALSTTGPESGSRELDAAHRRLLRSFDPET